MQQLSGQTGGWVVVTGASSGIGRATAEELRNRGYDVIAAVRRPEEWPMPGLLGDGVYPIRLDVGSEASIAEAVDKIARFTDSAPLAALINNAGIALPGPFECQGFGETLAQLTTNVIGPLRLTQALLPRLRESRGCIVAVSSVAGRLPMPFNAVHCGTKHFIEGMFESLRVELAETGIRVAIVEPGPIRTPMVTKFGASAEQALRALPDELKQTYGDRFSAMVQSLRAHVDQGAPPQEVARLIAKLIEKPRPATRYASGGRASLLLFLARILPDFARQALVSRFFGLGAQRRGAREDAA